MATKKLAHVAFDDAQCPTYLELWRDRMYVLRCYFICMRGSLLIWVRGNRMLRNFLHKGLIYNQMPAQNRLGMKPCYHACRLLVCLPTYTNPSTLCLQVDPWVCNGTLFSTADERPSAARFRRVASPFVGIAVIALIAYSSAWPELCSLARAHLLKSQALDGQQLYWNLHSATFETLGAALR